MVATALRIGLSLEDLDKISIGFLLDVMQEISGNDGTELEERYNKLKAIEKIVEQRYLKGEISEEKYINYRKAIQEYEEAS